jgi:phage/plasmid-like protein (TIGR03299 family)
MVALTSSVVPTGQRSSFVLGEDISSANNVSEALYLSNLNWGLSLQDAGAMTLMNENGVFNTTFPGAKFLMRDDTMATLNVVRSRYTPIDNFSVFGLADHIVAEGGTFIRGGEVDGGQQVFMDLELPNSTVSLLNGKDLTKFYVSIRGNHNNGNVTAEVKGTRLWCTNGCTAKIKGIPHSFKIPHNGKAGQRLIEAEKVLKGAGKYVNAFTNAVERMLAIKMDLVGFTKYIDTLFPKPEDGSTQHAMTIWENRRAELLTLFKFTEQNNLSGMENTAYAGFNVITEFEDWAGGIRRVNGRDEVQARARSLFLETDNVVKDRAFDMALAA